MTSTKCTILQASTLIITPPMTVSSKPFLHHQIIQKNASGKLIWLGGRHIGEMISMVAMWTTLHTILWMNSVVVKFFSLLPNSSLVCPIASIRFNFAFLYWLWPSCSCSFMKHEAKMDKQQMSMFMFMSNETKAKEYDCDEKRN